MKALSIRQPWAWLILNAGKDIENRNWPTHVRGRILIHAGKSMTRAEYEGALDTMNYVERRDRSAILRTTLPPFEQLQRGGFVGSVEIVDCVAESASPWFFGDFGFVLRAPSPLPFVPFRGQLGFFEVDEVL